MIREFTEELKENSKLRLGCIIGAAVAVTAVVCLLAYVSHVSWKEGGTDTNGPFRYGQYQNGSYEVRVNTKNLPDGTLAVVGDMKEARTRDKGQRGKEHRYRIDHIKDDSLFQWTLALYENEDAKEREEYRYLLTICFQSDADGNVQVLSADAKDIAKVNRMTEGDYTFIYQLQNVGDKEVFGQQSSVLVQIENAYSDNWKVAYDKDLLTADDLYYDLGTASTTISVAEGNEDSFQTDVTFYTITLTDEKETRQKELVLHIEGKDGVITGVTHAEK